MAVDDGVLPDWARAHGRPVLACAIRQTPDDFRVSEELGFEPSGDGEHDFLWIEKAGVNTPWLAQMLARHANVKPADVGYAGMKDRHAVTRQWFSIRRGRRGPTDWDGLSLPGVEILDISRNRRKLRRGAHRANRFRIALRGGGIGAARGRLRDRMAAVIESGIPNYFGEQRFGRDGANLARARALFSGGKLGRDQRSFALSAARAFLFNAILDCRVRQANWDRLLPGDRANLDGSGSVFAVDAVTPELVERLHRLELHPTATLWGAGAPLTGTQAAAVEVAVAESHRDLANGLVRAEIEPLSRPLRVRVRDSSMTFSDEVAWLEFRLAKGAFATAVLREMVDYSGQVPRRS